MTKISKTEKSKFIKTAKDLLYSEEIIKELNKATTDTECVRILKNARNEKE